MPISPPLPLSAIAPLVIAALALVPTGAGAGDATGRIGILPLPASAPAAVELTSAVVETARRAGAELVPPEEVAQAVAAAKQDPAACGNTPACAAAICAAVGARALLVTSVTESGRFWMVGVWMREAKGGWLKGHAVSAVSRDDRAVRDAAVKLVAQVLPAYLSNAPPAPAVASAPASPPPRPSAAPVPLPPPPVLAQPRPRVEEATPAPPRAVPVAPVEIHPRPAPRTETPEERLSARLATPAPRDRARSGASGWGRLLIGGGAALVAGGAAAGVLAWSESSDADLALARGDLGIYAIKRRSSQTFALTAAGVGGAGAAALAAGLWLRLRTGATPVELGASPGNVRVNVAF